MTDAPATNDAPAPAPNPKRLPTILVVGMPKSGTSTLQRAFEESGIVSAHWQWRGRAVGRLIYDGWFRFGDPLRLLAGVDAVTQMDFCHPESGRNYWPNLDIALLLAIRRLHPETRFILNDRAPEATAQSFARWEKWGSLTDRLAGCDITGLPKGRGAKPNEIVRWIKAHHDALREIFAGDGKFLDLDIAAPDARDRLGRFLGQEIHWWGVENANPAASMPEKEV